jgi:hypothetical protein
VPINNPLDDVESTPREAGGNPPVPHPRYVTHLAQVWHDRYDNSAPDFVGTDDRWRASWSGMCARAVGYEIQLRDAQRLAGDVDTTNAADVRLAEELVASLAPTNPPTQADAWRFGLGTMVHDGLEDVIRDAWPGAKVEVKVDFRPVLAGGGHADIVIDEDWKETIGAEGKHRNFRTLIELKTINGFAFKAAATTFKGWPEGPRSSAVVQGAVNALGLNADRLVIGYLALELLSPDVARRNGVDETGRFAAEWWYDRDEFVPIAEAELARVNKVLALVDDHQTVPRQIPDLPHGARIVNPANGMWVVKDGDDVVDTGTTWHCSYCRNQLRCLEDGA